MHCSTIVLCTLCTLMLTVIFVTRERRIPNLIIYDLSNETKGSRFSGFR